MSWQIGNVVGYRYCRWFSALTMAGDNESFHHEVERVSRYSNDCDQKFIPKFKCFGESNN